MKICDLSKNMSWELKGIIKKYARHLAKEWGGSEPELTIHTDNTVSLVCLEGYIIYHEKMTGELLEEAKRIAWGVAE